MSRQALVPAVGLIALLAVGAAQSRVTASAAGGFVSDHELILAAAPARAYQALTGEISRWWDPAHTFSGRAENLSIAAEAGGCFCEQLPGGGSVEHMRVVYAAPGALLRLQGGLGPLQALGATGVMSFELEAVGDQSTRLRYAYRVSGYVPGGLEPFAEPVDRVQLHQLERLAAWLRDGRLD